MSIYVKTEVVPLNEVPFEDRNDAELKPPVVLIVDDEPLVADTLSVILKREGFSVLTAYDAASALELAGCCKPELLITDVAMPEMNGVELAMAMLEAIPNCKVLLFSGHATSADLVNAQNAGHDFLLLAKPVHPTEMLRQVSKMLSVRERAAVPIHRAEVISIRRTA